jgi:uncharacterized DUF497 family protein
MLDARGTAKRAASASAALTVDCSSDRGDARRIISARRANAEETRAYATGTQDD